MRYIFAILIVCSCFLPISAPAEPAARYPAEATCTQWLVDRADVTTASAKVQNTAYDYWIAGFLDAAAVTRGFAVPERLDHGAFYLDLSNYCQANTAETLPRAATIILMRRAKK